MRVRKERARRKARVLRARDPLKTDKIVAFRPTQDELDLLYKAANAQAMTLANYVKSRSVLAARREVQP